MHTYKEVEDKYQVGYYILDCCWNAAGGGGNWTAPGMAGGAGGISAPPPVTSHWVALSEHDHEVQAAERVNHLNGGPCKFV